MSTISLKNQRIVIIGGSSGIGLATAKQAVEQGAAVIIAGRSQDKLEKAQQFLDFDSVEIYSLDNQNEQDLKAFFEKIGAFDHLFTPGASYVRGPITSSLEVAHNCFNAKFWPQYNAVKHAIPLSTLQAPLFLCPAHSANVHLQTVPPMQLVTAQLKVWEKH